LRLPGPLVEATHGDGLAAGRVGEGDAGCPARAKAHRLAEAQRQTPTRDRERAREARRHGVALPDHPGRFGAVFACLALARTISSGTVVARTGSGDGVGGRDGVGGSGLRGRRGRGRGVAAACRQRRARRDGEGLQRVGAVVAVAVAQSDDVVALLLAQVLELKGALGARLGAVEGSGRKPRAVGSSGGIRVHVEAFASLPVPAADDAARQAPPVDSRPCREGQPNRLLQFDAAQIRELLVDGEQVGRAVAEALRERDFDAAPAPVEGQASSRRRRDGERLAQRLAVDVFAEGDADGATEGHVGCLGGGAAGGDARRRLVARSAARRHGVRAARKPDAGDGDDQQHGSPPG
jgi:hypothetical protein